MLGNETFYSKKFSFRMFLLKYEKSIISRPLFVTWMSSHIKTGKLMLFTCFVFDSAASNEEWWITAFLFSFLIFCKTNNVFLKQFSLMFCFLFNDLAKIVQISIFYAIFLYYWIFDILDFIQWKNQNF